MSSSKVKVASRRAFLTRTLGAAVGAAILGLGAQCSLGSPPTPTRKSPAATKTPAVRERRRITWSQTGGTSQETSDKSWRLKQIGEAFPEIELVNQWMSYASYKDKVPQMVAQGEIADCQFCNAFNDVPLMMEAGLLQETGALLESYGRNILAATPKEAWESTIYLGKQYAAAHNIYDLNIWLDVYRQDWLDKLGLKVPETLDEVAEVLRAFTKGDPDGNNRPDTYGRTLYTTIRFDDDFFHGYDVAIGHHLNGFWRRRRGGIELDWVQPEMKEALGWLRARWEEGVFHPDSIKLPLGQRTRHWNSGAQGMAYMGYTEMDPSLQVIRQSNPTAQMVVAPAPKGPLGQGYTGEGFPWCYCISRKCKYPEDIIRIIDFVFTPEIAAQTICDGYPGMSNRGLNERGWCVEYTLKEKEAMGREWLAKSQAVPDPGTGGFWMPVNPGTLVPWGFSRPSPAIYGGISRRC